MNGISSTPRDENWNSYLFRIINIFNKNTDLNALKCLPTIFKAIDLKNIDRLEDTMDSLELAITLYGLLSAHFMLMTPEERKSQVQKNKQNAHPRLRWGRGVSRPHRGFCIFSVDFL